MLAISDTFLMIYLFIDLPHCVNSTMNSRTMVNLHWYLKQAAILYNLPVANKRENMTVTELKKGQKI